MFQVIFPLIFFTVFHVCYCIVKYELTVQGEAQHGYYATFRLGTPPQEISLLLDTGSSNIAVACVPTKPNSSKYFHYNESSTLLQLDIAVDLHYTVGQWNGFLAKDKIYFSNGEFESTIACMLSIDKVFDKSSEFQGLLGLAYPSIAIPDSSVHPFMDSLIAVKNVSDVFCLDLCGPYFSSKIQWTQCGMFQIGHISDAYSSDEIVYTPVDKEWYYQITLTDFQVGVNHVPVHCSELNKGRSIVDSGTTELYLPYTIYDWTIKEVRSATKNIPSKLWINDTVACVPITKFHMESFPSVTLSFYHTKNGTFNLVLSPELYLLPIQSPYINATCFKLAFAPSYEGFYIGSSVLKGFYVVFDRLNMKVGFANSSNFNGKNNFPGFVMKPKYTTNNIEKCKVEIAPTASDISPLMITILCTSVLVAFVLLYMLVSWIFRHFTMRTNDSSEANSLVGDDDDEFL